MMSAIKAAVFGGICALGTVPTAVSAQDAKQILALTKADWITVREYDGQDLLYFTNLLAWRCGVERIRYAVNVGKLAPLEHEPCHVDEAAPNALHLDDILPYLTFPQGAVDSVRVEVTFPDGSKEIGEYQRADVVVR